MTADESQISSLRANAELAIAEFRKLRGGDFGLDRGSVAWMEGYIERMRRSDSAASDGLISVIGSYLGEAILAAAGGVWAKHEGGDLGIKFACGDWCFPFAKVAKQFGGGLASGDSILSFYDVSVGYIAQGKLREAPAGAE